jgi:hypothetical protein
LLKKNRREALETVADSSRRCKEESNARYTNDPPPGGYALFRSVTQRSDDRRATPWRHLLDDIRDSLITLAEHHLSGLRRRKCSPLPALD